MEVKEVSEVECLRFVRPDLTHEEAVTLLGHDDAPEPPEPWSIQVERAQLQRVTAPPPAASSDSYGGATSTDPLPNRPGRWRRQSMSATWIPVTPGQERDTDLGCSSANHMPRPHSATSVPITEPHPRAATPQDPRLTPGQAQSDAARTDTADERAARHRTLGLPSAAGTSILGYPCDMPVSGASVE